MTFAGIDEPRTLHRLRVGPGFGALAIERLDAGHAPEEVLRRLRDAGIVLDATGLQVRGGRDRWSLSDGTTGVVVRYDGRELVVTELPEPSGRVIPQDPARALPAITLHSSHDPERIWRARHDLLSSGGDAREFVVEVENDGAAHVRFGDDRQGRRPNEGASFFARYRVGNGTAGNIGARALRHAVTHVSGIDELSNPMPATGGVAPESMEDVRQRAPFAYRIQERAVTPEDYAEVAERNSEVQRAVAEFRWTGSWHTVFLAIDRLGGREIKEPFEEVLRAHLARYRMAGHDLEIVGPRFVAIELALLICVKPEHSASDVEVTLLDVLSNRALPDGRLGAFHPDNLTFGQSVHLSPIIAAAQAVPGVASVQPRVFQRLDAPDPKPLREYELPVDRLEIARLDNDPSFPERGVLTLDLEGGR